VVWLLSNHSHARTSKVAVMLRLRSILAHLTFSRTISRMSSTIPHTAEACCQIPAVQSNYEPKGSKIQLGSYTEVYTVGNQKATTAVVAIFDIFGFFPQTQQGADILAETLSARVLMPDVFFGKPFSIEQHPPKNDEDKKALQTFFQTSGNFETVLPGILNLAKLLRDDGVTKLYLYGLCWGGKVSTLAGCQSMNIDGKSIPAFDAVACIHPAMLSAEDGKKLLVPIAIYASADESVDEYKKMVEELSTRPFASKNAYRVYPEMHHGWAGARADLDKENNHRDFTDVYGRLATFFKSSGEA